MERRTKIVATIRPASDDPATLRRAIARVPGGGRLDGRPGVALPPERFALETPTAEDLELLGAICRADFDAVAVSFVQSAADVQKVRAALTGDPPMLVAKIETQAAV